MNYEKLFDYLNVSVKKLLHIHVVYYIDRKSDYDIMTTKTIELFKKVMESGESPNTLYAYKTCIAVCFWLIHKYHDDSGFYNYEIQTGFNLHNISREYINEWEVTILKIVNWDLNMCLLKSDSNEVDSHTSAPEISIGC